MESSLEKIDQQEIKYVSELEAALAQYTELQQAADMDCPRTGYHLSRYSV